MTMQQLKKKQSTKNYDAVSKKVRKILSATAQTFIPELCDGLKKDWYPELTQEQIKNDKEARDSIRDKIQLDWSDTGQVLSENPWSEVTITNNFPDWLRNPTQQDSNSEALELAREARQAKINQKRLISEREKQKLVDFATVLPDSVIPPQPKEEEEDFDIDIRAGKPMSLEQGGKPITISQAKGNIDYHAGRLFQALTDIDHLPHNNEDVVDYIRDSREHRRKFILELDPQIRKRMYNDLGAVDAAVQDMLELLEKEITAS
jgi:hypothetical protein